MRLLIITQKVDREDAILGFFHRWIEEFARHFDKVNVICLEKGVFDLPNNVAVHSLGKELGKSNIRALYRFYKYIWNLRSEYDSVFVHMNPEYLILAGEIWKLLRKKITFWYTHRENDLKLRLASVYPDIIFTASHEGFTLKSPRVRVMGHGIDVLAFECAEYDGPKGGVIRLLHVGRITPIKHCIEAVEASKLLGDGYRFRFIGTPITKLDEEYFEELKKIAGPNVEFAGNLSPKDLPAEYCAADVTLNLTPTGGLDKAVLESMASGRLVLTSNKGFKEYLEPYASELLLGDLKAETIAKSIKHLLARQDLLDITTKLKATAEERASVVALIKNISEIIYG